MKIKPTSVLCRKTIAHEDASIYYKTRGAGEKWHELVACYSQLEGKLENEAVLGTWLEGLHLSLP
jgi:hypothetical protein